MSDRQDTIDRELVLVVDDDAVTRQIVTTCLENDGFAVVEVTRGDQVLEVYRARRPALIVLDIMLPGVDGLTLIRQLREFSDVPVLLLSGRSDELDRILGLEMGADDYIVKPFSGREVSTRAKAVLRRGIPSRESTVHEYGSLEIDLRAREVRVGGAPIELTAKEFDLLSFLAGSPRQVFSREQLLEHVWGSSVEWQSTDTVTEHVRRVRAKLAAESSGEAWLSTVRGIGYRFDA